MAKYTFNKNYETQIKVFSSNVSEGMVGGDSSTGTKQLKILKGTNIEGSLDKKSGLVNIIYDGNNILVDNSFLDLVAENKSDLKKYKFVKPYSTNISVGGVVGLSKYIKKIGDVVEGNLIESIGHQTEKTMPIVRVSLTPKTAMLLQGSQSYIDIPIEYLKEVDSYVNSIKPNVTKSTVSSNKLLEAIPFLLAGSGATIAYYKKLTPIQYAILIGGGFILGYGIKNKITYGNLIGWR